MYTLLENPYLLLKVYIALVTPKRVAVLRNIIYESCFTEYHPEELLLCPSPPKGAVTLQTIKKKARPRSSKPGQASSFPASWLAMVPEYPESRSGARPYPWVGFLLFPYFFSLLL